MQASNIAPVQSSPVPALPGATMAPGAAASWQAALNAAQVPDGQDAPSQNAQSHAAPPQTTQQQQSQPQTVQGSAAAAPAPAPVQNQDKTSQSGTAVDKVPTATVPRPGAAQDGAVATAKHMKQRHDIIAAAASAQVEAHRTKPQDKTQNKGQNSAVPGGVAQQAQPVQLASAPKAAVQAGGQAVSQAAKPAAQAGTPMAAPADAPMAATAAPDSGNDTPATAAHTDGTSPHQPALISSGQSHPGTADMLQVTGAAPAAAATPGLVAAQEPAQNATAKALADAAPGKAVAAAGTSAVSVPKPTPGMAQEVLQAIQPASTGGDKGKTASISTPGGLAVPAVHAVAGTQNVATGSAPAEVPASSTVLPVSTNASAAGLAATVTALHQSGQSGATFRLDPPGLGSLAVHVVLGQQGQVNVLFVPSTQAAGTALQSGLPGLGQALAQSGLTLGQAQVGGQFGQNAGQGGQQPQTRQGAGTANTFAAAEPAAPSTQNGVSAYA